MSVAPFSPSFFAPPPEQPRDDLLRAYLAFLEERNGTTDATQAYPHRERWLQDTQAWQARHRGEVDAEAFERNYARFDPATRPDLGQLALLAFVKVNAGEAYGVEVVSRKRHGTPPTGALFDTVERVIGQEETYHTRILVGASRQFGLSEPTSAWKPPAALKAVIAAIAYSPKALFHPILLGAELGGVYTFNWMLERVGQVFREQPDVAEAMERRLVEILIDEVGHVAFNRMAVGPTGLATARALSSRVVDATQAHSPEFRGLGWTDEDTRAVSRFDLSGLPEEVRRRSFFV
jgi:hypothetical protein